jgi:hypothetical protein
MANTVLHLTNGADYFFSTELSVSKFPTLAEPGGVYYLLQIYRVHTLPPIFFENQL